MPLWVSVSASASIEEALQEGWPMEKDERGSEALKQAFRVAGTYGLWLLGIENISRLSSVR